MKRLSLLLVPLLLGACAGSVAPPVTPGTAPPVVPTLNLALARDGAMFACFQLSKGGAAASLLTKVNIAQALLTSSSPLSAIENALLARETDPGRRIYLALIIDLVPLAGVLPDQSRAIDPTSPAGQYIAVSLAGCRKGLGLTESAVAEAVGAPLPPALSDYLVKSFPASLGKGEQWFDTSLPFEARVERGKVNLAGESGTYARVGLDPAKIKGPMVGPEGLSCVPIQFWIDTVGLASGVPPGYQCQASDVFDAEFIDGRSGFNFYNDQVLRAWNSRPQAPPANPPPGGGTPPPSICLSGQCIPDLCPANCPAPPPVTSPPPIIPLCPAHPALVVPAGVQATLAAVKGGQRVFLNQGRLLDAIRFFAAHPGLVEKQP